ncbi:MAG: hypothetical protein ACYDDF_03730 [Thermoplasmatota archaeon]
MTVKDRVGRVRHIAFRLERESVAAAGSGDSASREVHGLGASRETLNAFLRAVVDAASRREDRPNGDAVIPLRIDLTAFDGLQGLVRVRHVEASAIRRALAEAGPIATPSTSFRLVTLGTSGTMKQARQKWLPTLAPSPRKREPKPTRADTGQERAGADRAPIHPRRGRTQDTGSTRAERPPRA